jgi:hypothetical protein
MGKGASLITTGLQKSFYAEVHSPNSARHHAKVLAHTYIPLFPDPTVVNIPLGALRIACGNGTGLEL